MSSIKGTETEIVEGCKKFNRDAQKSLYRMYYGKMNAVSYRYTNSYDDAKDIVHDSFLVIFEKIVNYNGQGSLEGWIRKVVVNKSIDFLNKRNKTYSKITETEQHALNNLVSQEEYKNDSEQENFNSIYHSGVTKEEIIEAIDLLKETYKIIFNLNVIEGFSHKSIAEMLSITEELSRIRLKRARTALQALLLNIADKKTKQNVINQTNEESIRK